MACREQPAVNSRTHLDCLHTPPGRTRPPVRTDGLLSSATHQPTHARATPLQCAAVAAAHLPKSPQPAATQHRAPSPSPLGCMLLPSPLAVTFSHTAEGQPSASRAPRVSAGIQRTHTHHRRQNQTKKLLAHGLHQAPPTAHAPAHMLAFISDVAHTYNGHSPLPPC